MNNNILLSICIPAYNNTANLSKKISDIFSHYTDNDIEIVVSDNCSSDGADEVFKSFNDKRLYYISNEKNDGPILNGMRALANAHGKYAVFLLDKDILDVKFLPPLINLLKTTDFAEGYCSLNLPERKYVSFKKFKTISSCLKNLAYLSKHPTGYIFNNELLKKIDIEKKYGTENQSLYFSCEFICADLSLYGNGIIIDIPVFHMTKLLTNCNSKGNENGSKTFSKERNNIYFMPERRFQVFEKYAGHLKNLKIPEKTKKIIFIKLLFDVYKQTIVNYKFMIEDKIICAHHKIDVQNIDSKQLGTISSTLKKNIKKSDIFEHTFVNLFSLFCIQIFFFFVKILYPVVKILKYKRNT